MCNSTTALLSVFLSTILVSHLLITLKMFVNQGGYKGRKIIFEKDEEGEN